MRKKVVFKIASLTELALSAVEGFARNDAKWIWLSLLFLLFGSGQKGFAAEPTEAHVAQLFSQGPAEISLPLQASQFTGEAYTSVPIEIAPAAGEIAKKIKLELQYRSGAGNSWLGKGWDMDLGYVCRINKYGANNANNPYLLVLNGSSYELVNTGGEQYRTQMESHKRIQFNGSAWRVWEKDGTEYKFELFCAGKWLLTRVTDLRGISLVIDYDRAGADEIYLKEIRYPEGLDLTAYCKVVFISEARQDKVISYYFGPACRLNRRLKEIQVLVNDNLQKRYALNYTANGTSYVSFLASVVEYGKDGSALPAMTFTYRQPARSNILGQKEQWLADSGVLYTQTASYSTSMGGNPPGINIAVLDLNNDNFPDLIGCKYMYPGSENERKSLWVVHRGTGNGFSAQEETWAQLDNSGSPDACAISVTRGSSLIDMNKDGLPDLVYIKYAGQDGNTRAYVYDLVVRYNTGTKFSDTETKLLDHNQTVYSYQGRLGTAAYDAIKLGENAALMDMNGDGLPDLVYHRQHHWDRWVDWDVGSITVEYLLYDLSVRLNTGSGFSSQDKVWLDRDKSYFKYMYQSWYSSVPVQKVHAVDYICLNRNAMFVDMNNDGLPDLVYNDFAKAVDFIAQNGSHLAYPSFNWKVRYNTGEKFSDEETMYLAGAPVFVYYVSDPNLPNSIKSSIVRIGENGTLSDVNNDGLQDLVYNQFLNKGGTGDYSIDTPWAAGFNTGNGFASGVKIYDSVDYLQNYLYFPQWRSNVLTYNSYLTDVNKDGIADITYPQYTDWQTGNVGSAKFKIMVCKNRSTVGTDLLSRQTSIFGGSSEITYQSSGSFNNTLAGGKNGLSFIIPVVSGITKNPGVGASGVTAYNYSGGWYDIPARKFRGFGHVQTTDPLNYTSHIYFHQDDSRLAKVERQENSITRVLNTYKEDNTLPFWAPLVQTDEYMDTKCRRTGYDYDDYGNVIKTTYYGDADTAGDEKCELTDYALNTSAWLVNLPARSRVFGNAAASGAALAESLYYYDNHANYTDAPAKGDLTKAARYLDTAGSYIQNTSAYDSYGNQISKTDANGRTTNIAYDTTYHLFPVSVANPKGQVEKIAYYGPADNKGIFGQARSKTDVNNNQTIFEYDGFGRKTKVIGPYDASSTYGSEAYEYGLNGPGANFILTRTTEESGTSNHLAKVDILDGFEKVIQSSKESEDEGTFIYSATFYNARGEVDRVSLPYLASGGLRKSYLAPDESSAKWTRYSYDALGRITQIAKPDLSMVSTAYSGWTSNITDENGHAKIIAKDAYERIAGVIEKNTQDYSTKYKYDALDNLTLITDHFGNQTEFLYDSLKRKIKMRDPDLGEWLFGYDNNGNLVKTTNGKQQVINYAYDELNRLIARDYAAQAGLECGYKYDETSSTNGIGRRTGMQDLSGSSRWDYDAEGRLIKLEKIIDGNTYKIEWVYDAMDRLKCVLLPNQKTVNFSYNNAGLTKNIDGYISGTSYNAASQPVTVNFINPIVTRFDYYPDTQRLKSILSGSVQDLNYEYDPAGNVAKVSDRIRGSIKNYTYDALDRLLSGDGNNYEYNAIGNITRINGTAQQYSNTKPHALTNDGVNIYSYDGCGNMLAGAGRNISYDVENRPVNIIKDSITTQFVYDGDGKRVKKTVRDGPVTTTTVYIENLYEKEIIQ